MAQVPMEKLDPTPAEKILLLAGELLRDQGVENVTSHHIATLLGQVLACTAVHDGIEPFDRRTLAHFVDRAGTVAAALHQDFIEQCRNV